MNQPTEERFKQIEEEQRHLKEELRKLRQQMTDEIKTVKVEVGSSDVQNRLDNHTEFLQELDRKSDLHTQAFVRIETILKGHTDGINTLQKNVATIKETMATKPMVDELRQDMQKRFDAIAEVQKMILARLPEKRE